MAVNVNLRHLEEKVIDLQGELSPKELDFDDLGDEMVKVTEPLKYDLTVERSYPNLLVQGELRVDLDCTCVRCLRPFTYHVELDPWDCFVPLEGEEAAVVNDDCVDLTPYLREDTLLAFPQHPLCAADCAGLQSQLKEKSKKQPGGTDQDSGKISPWTELDKLKLK
ncbi:MAG: YceD family protein [Verrucomicrobiota bacterium]|nr:YceD family protein [Verrucomicrobiota bacterium]